MAQVIRVLRLFVMRYSYDYKRKAVELYRQGQWPDTPEDINTEDFHGMIRRWARIEESCGTNALRYHKLINSLKNSHFRDIIRCMHGSVRAGGVPMAVSYKKLFHMMIEKDMTNGDLQKQAGFSANIITRLKRGGYISLESVENICRVMDCGVDDILEFVPESDNKAEGE